MGTKVKKFKILFLFLMMLLLILPISFNITKTNDNNIYEENFIEIKMSASWNILLTSSMIIDEDTSSDWSYYETTYTWCTGSGTLSDPYTIENVTFDGQNLDFGDLLIIRNSEDINVTIKNCTFIDAGGSNYGLQLFDSSSVTIEYCYFDASFNAILIEASVPDSAPNYPINVKYNYIYGSLYLDSTSLLNTEINIYNNTFEINGISTYQYNAKGTVLIENNTFINSAISYTVLGTNDDLIINNNFFNDTNGAILLSANTLDYHGVDVNVQITNNIMKVDNIGIATMFCDEIYIYNNRFECDIIGDQSFYKDDAILLIASSDNEIFDNVIIGSFQDGITCVDARSFYTYMLGSFPLPFNQRCQGNDIINNDFVNIRDCAVNLTTISVDNNVSLNTIINASKGIAVGEGSTINYFTYNEIYNCSDGIYVDYANTGEIKYNNIINCTNYGIYLDNVKGTVDYFDIDHNFLNNTNNARDDSVGTNNNWDDGSEGNYWDDYTGTDSNKDGIGDTPYSIFGTAGSQDNYPLVPIERKDWDAPIVYIILPEKDSFWYDRPDYELYIIENNTQDCYYAVNDGTGWSSDYPMPTVNGTLISNINPTLWNGLNDGNITLRFYVEDVYEVSYNETYVTKDTISPIVTIINLNDDDLFDSTPPYYEFNVVEDNVDDMWYTLSDGVYTTDPEFISSTTGIIDYGLWNTFGNEITLTFYANDSVNLISSDSVDLIKDVDAPQIYIVSPTTDEIFNNAPDFEVNIVEPNFIEGNYSLNDGSGWTANRTFTSTNGTNTGTINSGDWSSMNDGTVIIRFYGEDSFRVSYNEVSVIKDTVNPVVSILNIVDDDVYGRNAPYYEIGITEINLNSIWYKLDDGIITYNRTIISLSGFIDETLWDSYDSGMITITFYANDSTNLIGFDTVDVEKDLIAPTFSILEPETDQECNSTAPYFELDIVDLDHSEYYYSLDNGITRINCSISGFIDQEEWNYLAKGYVNITFYVVDAVGNERNMTVRVYKGVEAIGKPQGIDMVVFAVIGVSAFAVISLGILIRRNRSRNMSFNGKQVKLSKNSTNSTQKKRYI